MLLIVQLYCFLIPIERYPEKGHIDFLVVYANNKSLQDTEEKKREEEE